MSRRRTRLLAFVAALIVGAAVLAELAMGRLAICECGYVKVWHGIVQSSENSQHITDWYTFTHIIHGIAFYALLWLAVRRLPPEVRLVMAVLLEASWEVVENTPFVIDRYRAATVSLTYYGDTVVNSLSDIAAMVAGFWMAWKWPRWASAALAVAIELALAIIIRDNLTLNILMLIHPFDAIKRWQMGL